MLANSYFCFFTRHIIAQPPPHFPSSVSMNFRRYFHLLPKGSGLQMEAQPSATGVVCC